MEGKKNLEKIILQWETGEDQKKINSVFGIAVFFVLIIGFLTYAFYTRQWFSGAVFIILAITLAWYLLAQTKSLKILLTDKGVWIEKQFYSFEKIKGYWISEQNKTIYLIPKQKFMPTIAVPAGKYKIADIAQKFPPHVIRTEGEEGDFIDKISKLLKK